MNVCSDLGSKRRRHDETRAATKAGSPTLNPAARHMDAEIEMHVIEEGLRTLTERERAAVTLRDIEGQSTREVAAIMGVTEMTVRTLICRGRVKLKRHRDQHLGA